MLRKRPKFQINRTVGRQRYIKTPAEPMQISRRTRIPIFNDNIAAYTEPLQAKTVEAYPVKTEEPAFTDEIKQLIDRLEHKEQLNSSLEAFALFAVLIENIPDIKIKLHYK